MLTNDERCTCEIKPRIAMAKVAFNKKRALFTNKINLELRKKLVKCYIFIMLVALYGFENWKLREIDQKHLESFVMWLWRSMEKIIWTNHVRNEEVMLTVKKQRNILHEISRRKANWIDYILRRNCLLQRVIKGKLQGGIKVTGRRGRRRTKLLDNLKERTGYSYLNEEAIDRTMRRDRVERCFGSVAREAE
jgi:hypothetical protein